MPTDSELKSAAERLIKTIDDNLKKWVSWFPDGRSGVDVPRDDLLALKHYAEIGLAQRADDDEEVDADFLKEVGMRPMASHQGAFETPDGVVIFNPWEYGWVVCNGRPKINTRGQLRQLLSALGVQSGGDAG